MPVHSFIRPEIWKESPHITAAFSTRNAAGAASGTAMDLTLAYRDSEPARVTETNRKRWLEEAGLEGIPLALGKQVHGSQVQIVKDDVFQPNTDGLVTTQRNLAIGILVADCAAVLLADPENKVIAAVHAGWRGAVSGILNNALFNMLLCGADMQKIEVFVSPCISAKAFEVGDEVAQRFPENCVDYLSYEKPHVDLNKFINKELMAAGILKENIESSGLCTVGNKDLLHSHRRDREKSGRMMAVICML